MNLKNMIIVILMLLVVSMGGYLVYDKIFTNDKCVVDENNKVDNDEKVENNSSIDDSDNKEYVVDNGENQYNVRDIDSYKNSDGSYASVETVSLKFADVNYYVQLSLDGKIYVLDNNGRKKVEVISNVSDVIDIHEFYDEIGELTTKIYILTQSGDVYVYKFADLLDKKYVASKVDGVSDIEKINTITWCPEKGTGCITNHVAVTINGEIIKLSGFSV